MAATNATVEASATITPMINIARVMLWFSFSLLGVRLLGLLDHGRCDLLGFWDIRQRIDDDLVAGGLADLYSGEQFTAVPQLQVAAHQLVVLANPTDVTGMRFHDG